MGHYIFVSPATQTMVLNLQQSSKTMTTNANDDIVVLGIVQYSTILYALTTKLIFG
jgi:hypothetical protein